MIKLKDIVQEGDSRNIGYAKFIFSLQTLISDLAPNAWEDKSQIDSTSMKRIHNSLKKRYGSDYKKYNALLKTQKGQFGWWYLKEGSEVHEGMMDRLGKFMYKANALVFPKMTAGKFFLMFRQHNLDIRDTLTKAYVDKTLPTEKVKREFYTLLKGLKESINEGDIQLWTAPAKSYRYGMEYYKLKSKNIIKKLPSKKTKKGLKYTPVIVNLNGKEATLYLREGMMVQEELRQDELEKFATDLAYSMPNHTKYDDKKGPSDGQIMKAMKKYQKDLYQYSTKKQKKEVIKIVSKILADFNLKERSLVHEDFSKRDWDVKWKMPKDNLFNATKTTDAVKNRYKALQFLLKGRPKELRAFDNNDNHPAYDMSYDELMKWYNGLKEGVIREGKWMDLWDESQEKAPSAWTKHQKWIVANAERYGFDPTKVKKLLKQHTAIHNRTYGMFASVEDWMEEKLK
jgi:phenylpyruvate tautomerase PptA (4-oxalocrotonate tautomerase family)